MAQLFYLSRIEQQADTEGLQKTEQWLILLCLAVVSLRSGVGMASQELVLAAPYLELHVSFRFARYDVPSAQGFAVDVSLEQMVEDGRG